MKPFKSAALGEPHEYRALFSDLVGITVADAAASGSFPATCRTKSSEPWAEVLHDQMQLRTLCHDMNEAEDEDGDNAPAKQAKPAAEFEGEPPHPPPLRKRSAAHHR